MRQELGKGACNQAAALLHHRCRPSRGVLQFCCVAPLNIFEVASASIAQRVPGRPHARTVLHDMQKREVWSTEYCCHASSARSSSRSPAELHFAQTCEAGDTILVITDGFETHQSSVHAQPKAIYAERD